MSSALLGILLQRYPGSKRPFGALTPFVERVSALAGYEGVDVVAFGPCDMQERGAVRAGRYLGPQLGWRFDTSPLPGALWNRCFRTGCEEALRRVSALGIPLLNQPGIDKWRAHRLLGQQERLRAHLPHTELLTCARKVCEMLNRYPTVFIKPVSGSVGRGIIRVGAAGTGQMCLQYISGVNKRPREVYAVPVQLERWLDRAGNRGRYIVQQGLELCGLEGRPADVRVLVQKDGTGRWTLTGAGARLAKQGRFTTNLHTGGQGLALERLIQEVAPHDAQRQRQLIEQLHRLALEVAHLADREAGPMGELGLDFGIDRVGHIWYIEQNAQPGRAIFDHIGRADLAALAHVQPVRYARYLMRKNSC